MDKRPETVVRISPETTAVIHDLAERNGYSERDFLMWGLSLAKLVLEEREQGNSLILIDEEGRPLSKILLPEVNSQVIDKTVREILDDPCSLSLARAIADLDPDSTNSPTQD
jgi:hypothetical protein